MYGLMNKSIRLQCKSIIKRLVCHSIKKKSLNTHRNEQSLSHDSSVKKSSLCDKDNMVKIKVKQQTNESHMESNKDQLIDAKLGNILSSGSREIQSKFSKNGRKDYCIKDENKSVRSKSFPLSSRNSNKSFGNRSLKQQTEKIEKLQKYNFNAWIKTQDDGGIYKGPDS
jgi:hypothetical protein